MNPAFNLGQLANTGLGIDPAKVVGNTMSIDPRAAMLALETQKAIKFISEDPEMKPYLHMLGMGVPEFRPEQESIPIDNYRPEQESIPIAEPAPTMITEPIPDFRPEQESIPIAEPAPTMIIEPYPERIGDGILRTYVGASPEEEGAFDPLFNPNKTRKEISDKDIKIKAEFSKKHNMYAGVITLNDLISAPTLFKKYPYLKDLSVVQHDPETIENGENFKAGYVEETQNEPEKIVLINKNINSNGYFSTILHEIQHAIQAKEGWAMGGRVGDGKYKDYQRIAGEVEARDTASRKGLSLDQRRSQAPYTGQGIKLADIIQKRSGGKAMDTAKGGEITVYRGEMDRPRNANIPSHVTDSNARWVSPNEEFASQYGKVTKYTLPKDTNILDVNTDYELADKFLEKYGDDVWFQPSKKAISDLKKRGYDGFQNEDNILIFDKSKLSPKEGK